MKTRILIAGLVVLAVAAGAAVGIGRKSSVESPDPRAQAIFSARLPDSSGVEHDLARYRGKVVVVNFWASWCAPCIEEMPGFVRLQEKYRDRGLVFVGVAIDDPDAVGPFMQRLGINYPVLTAEAAGYELLKAAGDEKGVMPYTLLIDRTGAVSQTRAGIYRESELDQALAALL
ncbi:MAG: TlpA disulfide reductase family protein [Burkholderiales bacterium]|jgi:peroxiredoxin|nr:TlpA family protein disulfide reductase [Betaproteobacteria bacterium]